ncbi:hypothetical protein H6G36_27160 [Anabaena minutissima FACHB-250]|nr:hypothetical protein [Anabaena minutissima FACHB-250]
MKKKLFYGNFNRVRPKSEQIKIEKIQTQADGSTSIFLNGINVFEIQEETQAITWGKLLYSRLHDFCNEDKIKEIKENCNPPELFYYDIVDGYINILWNDLKKSCHEKADAEKHFFELYCEVCHFLCDHIGQQVADLPALIPSVHINWECIPGNREKPCTVDFVFKSPKFGTNNLVIVEIDGASHYAEYVRKDNYYSCNEDKYVEHLKKDRWLRKQGFQVFRIGNSEIENIVKLPGQERIDSFYEFLQEVFGISI